MCEFYNNSRPYIIQKDHRKLLGQIQKIYISKNEEEASKLYKELIDNYKDDKLLLMVINRCISDIMKVIKYSREARRITSYTESFIKLKAKLNREVNDYKVFDEAIEIKIFLCELLKKEEEQFKPSKRNWALIINEMDSIITDRIKEKI
jgi:transposase-like protein